MSQVLNAIAPLEALKLQMIANGTTTSSGSTYDLDLGDDSVFQVNLQSGSSITLDATAPHKLNLKAGLYQINLAGRVQLTANSYGSFDYELYVSTDPTFTLRNVLYDRANLWYGNGSSANTRPIIDQNHTVLFNTTTDTTVYFQIKVANDSTTTWNLIGSATHHTTTLDVVRLGGALS